MGDMNLNTPPKQELPMFHYLVDVAEITRAPIVATLSTCKGGFQWEITREHYHYPSTDDQETAKSDDEQTASSNEKETASTDEDRDSTLGETGLEPETVVKTVTAPTARDNVLEHTSSNSDVKGTPVCIVILYDQNLGLGYCCADNSVVRWYICV